METTFTKPKNTSLAIFLSEFFRALLQARVHFCVLRNYEDFPAANRGNDIDLLIRHEQLPQALAALRSVPNIELVGYAQRAYVANVFVAGASAVAGRRAIQVDFDLSLSWKGIPFLSVDDVLARSIPGAAEDLDFFIPCPVHEAIISLFASLLVAGFVKERYIDRVRDVFNLEREQAIGSLTKCFGEDLAAQLIKAIVDKQRDTVLELVGPLRQSLLVRSLSKDPRVTLCNIASHYLSEVKLRFSPSSLETVVIVGSDHHSRRLLIDEVLPMLRSFAVVCSKEERVHSVSDPSHSSVSTLRIARLLLSAWSQQFLGRTNLTLLLSAFSASESTPRTLLGSHSIAKFMAKLFPAPDIVIRLETEDAPEPPRERNPNRTISHFSRQRGIVAASANIENVEARLELTEHLYSAIRDALSIRTKQEMSRHARSQELDNLVH